MSALNDELEKSLNVLLEDLLNLKSDERLLICGDIGSDKRVIGAAVVAGKRIGAETNVNVSHYLRGALKANPSINLTLAMQNADVICDFSERYLSYTQAWKNALKAGARGYCLGNITSEAIIRCIGKVDISKIMAIGRTLTKLSRKANVIRITSRLGTNMSLKMTKVKGMPIIVNRLLSLLKLSESWVGSPTGICHGPGQSTFLSGQVSFNGVRHSINGTSVFDGFVWPPYELGLLKSPIIITVRRGEVIDIEGGQNAQIFRKWLKNFDDRSMFEIAHFSYGFNPGARLSHCISESERYFGCIVVGIGSHPSHIDGVIKEPSVQIDGKFIEKNGKYQFDNPK